MTMTQDVECIHGLTPQTCSLCKRPRPLAPVAREATGWAFQARYRGRCTVCHEEIDLGELIFRDDVDGYLHVGCDNA